MTLTGLMFFAVFFLAIGLAFLRHPIYGLYAYMMAFYVHPPSRWWGASLPDLRWAMLSAAATVLAIWFRGSQLKNKPSWLTTTPARIMIAYVLWFWLGTLWALDRSLHIPQAILLTKFLLLFYIFYRVVDSHKEATLVLLVHLAGCFYLGYLGFTTPSEGGRLDGVGGPGINDSNTLGMQLATGVVAGAMMILYLKGYQKYLCVVAIAFALNGIVLTGSRGAALALLAGGIALAFLRPIAYKRAFMAYAVLGLFLIGILASGEFWNRMQTLRAVQSEDQSAMDSSARSRIAMFEAQARMAAKYPLGTGHRGSEILSPEYLDHAYLTVSGFRSSHNTFMTVLVEQGIPGFLLSLALIGWTAKTLLMIRRRNHGNSEDMTIAAAQAAAIGGTLVVVAVGGFFADFAHCEVQIWVFAMLAINAQNVIAATGAK